jgi:tetratricopeptide (TPR) repeat protein
MRVARVQGVPISPTLGQMDEAEKNLRMADTFIQSTLKAQPENRTAMLRAAQIAHDRMILARFGHRYEAALNLAKESAKWLEKYDARKGDETESSGILNTYLNVADQFKSEGESEEALRLCNHASEIAGILNRPTHRGNFLRISAGIFQQRGDLDQALKFVQESAKILDPGPDWLTKGSQSSNFQLALVYEGRILGEDNSVNLGRPEEAVRTLESAFQMADEFVHRDQNDHSSRGALAMAGIPMADILRHSDARRALDVYDHTLRHLAETPGDAHLQRYEVQLLAGSSYPLRQLGRANEARQRIDKAREKLKELKFDPEEIELGSEMEETYRALADNEAASGNLPQVSTRSYSSKSDHPRPTKNLTWRILSAYPLSVMPQQLSIVAPVKENSRLDWRHAGRSYGGIGIRSSPIILSCSGSSRLKRYCHSTRASN